MSEPNFHDKLVKKPWGEEYLLLENPHVAVWHLKIKEGYETSLHAHPNKKTGLVVLSGGAKVSFLSDDHKLFPGEKIMIRQGVFHKTHAVVNQVELLEIETPKNKLDLIRLEDAYGRAGTPYEKTSLPYDAPIVKEKTIRLGNCNVSTGLLQAEKNSPIGWNALLDSTHNDAYMILSGSLGRDNFSVAGPGDVLYRKNLALMISKFEVQSPLYVMRITPCI